MRERMKKKIENVEPEALGFRNCATLAYRSQPLRGGGGGRRRRGRSSERTAHGFAVEYPTCEIYSGGLVWPIGFTFGVSTKNINVFVWINVIPTDLVAILYILTIRNTSEIFLLNLLFTFG